MKLLIMQLSPGAFASSLLGPNVLTRILFRNSHVKAAGKSIVFCTLIFTFLGETCYSELNGNKNLPNLTSYQFIHEQSFDLRDF